MLVHARSRNSLKSFVYFTILNLNVPGAAETVRGAIKKLKDRSYEQTECNMLMHIHDNFTWVSVLHYFVQTTSGHLCYICFCRGASAILPLSRSSTMLKSARLSVSRPGMTQPSCWGWVLHQDAHSQCIENAQFFRLHQQNPSMLLAGFGSLGVAQMKLGTTCYRCFLWTPWLHLVHRHVKYCSWHTFL